MEMISDIPRNHTAVAEWAACVIYIMLLKKHIKGGKLIFSFAIMLVLQLLIQQIAGILPITFWIPGMLFAVLAMYSYIFLCCDITPLDAGYCLARAFIVAEFAASLEWQIHSYFLLRGVPRNSLISSIIMIFIYSIVFILIYIIESKRIVKSSVLAITLKELFSSVLVAVAAFFISNINFVFGKSIFNDSTGAGLMYIRTLINFSGVTMFYAQQEQRNELKLKHELEAMNNILYRQYEQYQQSKESIEVINRKYHDMKYQIAIIQEERNPQKRDDYLEDIVVAINHYEAQNKTGNSVLDTVLTSKSLICAEKKITLTCVVDGELLEFMEVMDICTIFGNALDNAIESVEKIEAIEKRLIKVALYSQNNFIMIRFENYFMKHIEFEEGLPKTTKTDNGFHGYGIKSIKFATKKYMGTVTINVKNNWFYLRILLPIK